MLKASDWEWKAPLLTAKPTTVHALAPEPGGRPRDRYAIIDGERHRRCPKCMDMHPATLEFFYVDPADKDGLTKWCKACQIEVRYERFSRRSGP